MSTICRFALRIHCTTARKQVSEEPVEKLSLREQKTLKRKTRKPRPSQKYINVRISMEDDNHNANVVFFE